MNLLARILSHGFAFAVVALIILVLMYRGDLFEEWDLPDFLAVKGKPDVAEDSGSGAVDRAPAPVEEASEDTSEDTVASTPALDADEPVTTDSADVTKSPPAAEPVAAPDTHGDAGISATDTEQDDAPPVDETATTTPSDAPDTDTETATSDSIEAAAEPGADEAVSAETEGAAGEAESPSPSVASVVAGTEDEAVPAVSDTGAATADSVTPAVEPDAAETPYSVLAKAREAYWLRDFTTAEQQYKKLVQLEPGNPDGYGELGNMYFSRGMWDQAENAYYEAGVRLLDEGLVVQARQMVEVIRGLNGSQADKLDAQITAVSTTSP